MIDPFPSIIADTPVGEISDPFESEQGWHILKVEERRTRPPKTKEEMRPEIVTYLTFTEISRILRELRANAVIDQRDGRRAAVTPPPEVPEDILANDASGEETNTELPDSNEALPSEETGPAN